MRASARTSGAESDPLVENRGRGGRDAVHGEHCGIDSRSAIGSRGIVICGSLSLWRTVILAAHVEDGMPAAEAVRETLARWRRFWGAVPAGGLRPDEIRGLFGELWFLLVWLLPHGSAGVEHWVGATGARDDFQWTGVAVEVKTTSSIRGHIHRINGIDQLDPPQDGSLRLFSLRLRDEPASTNSLLSLTTTIRPVWPTSPSTWTCSSGGSPRPVTRRRMPSGMTRCGSGSSASVSIGSRARFRACRRRRSSRVFPAALKGSSSRSTWRASPSCWWRAPPTSSPRRRGSECHRDLDEHGRDSRVGLLKVVRDDGVVLDATFSVSEDPLSVVFESAGGKTGVNARNRHYSEGLTTILRRLADVDAVVTEIRVESLVTRRLPVEQQRIRLTRHALPLRMRDVVDIDDLKRDVSRGARDPGARPGSQRGGSSRRLRLVVSHPGRDHEALAERLSGTGTALDPDSVQAIVDMAAGRVRRTMGQGFLSSVEHRLAVERHAMEAAVAWYGLQGWTCQDVSRSESYDLRCTKGPSVLHVEVKGTTTDGGKVIVTRGEVEEARRLTPDTELFVLAGVEVAATADGAVVASGGRRRQVPAWGTDDGALVPLGYELRL
jgi:hypothetical protein